jgi:acetyl-CoA/propionyl-CoA carboxylase carboxyl transferase subunit
MTRTATSIEAAVAIAAQTSVEPDYRDPVHRMCQLLDSGSFEAIHRQEGSGVVVARGRIDGAGVVVYCTDGTRAGDAIGPADCPPIVEAIDLAVAENCPVVGMWHSARAQAGGTVDGLGRVYATMVHASGRVPQLTLVLGPAAGTAAHAAALSDVVVVVGDAGSGVAHLTAGSEAAAYRRTREVVALLTRPGRYDLERLRSLKDPSALLPADPAQPYDVRPLVEQLVDHDSFIELQAAWATGVVVGLGRLGGRTVGIVANDGGHPDSGAAEKAARFVRTCDTFGIPLVVVADVTGRLGRDVDLAHAFAEAVAPRVTLVTRAHGTAAAAMNSRALDATAVVAWPGTELAADVVDEVVDPVMTRRRLAELLASAPAGRGRHGNISL